MTTVAIYLPQLSTVTGLTLLLTKSSDYSAVNGAGDALTESGTSGWFTADVAEAWTETLGAAVVDSGGLVPVSGRLGVNATVVSDGLAALDSAALALINKIEASTAGTVSGAGTDTEIFVGSNVTLTITVDEDGNRSAVVVS